MWSHGFRGATTRLRLHCRQTNPPMVFVGHVHIAVTIVESHWCIVTFIPGHSVVIRLIAIAPHRSPASGTPACPLAVAGQRIPTRKLAIAFRTYMRLLARVKLPVSLQVMQTPKSQVTSLAQVGFLLTVSQQVTLQIVVARKLGVAIRSLVLFI